MKNKTDFEKLLFAKKYIEVLKSDIEILKREKDDLRNELRIVTKEFKQENPDLNALIKYKNQVKTLRDKCNKYKRLYKNAIYDLIKEKQKYTS